jgi:hypothetical protein
VPSRGAVANPLAGVGNPVFVPPPDELDVRLRRMRGKATAVHEHSASSLGSRVDRHGMRKLDAHDADAHTNADCHASPYPSTAVLAMTSSQSSVFNATGA